MRSNTAIKLTPLHLYIILHLRMVGEDYAKSIARSVELQPGDIQDALNQLEEVGIVERATGATVKNTEAKLKLSREVRRHHLYYKLSRKGKELWKKLRSREAAAKIINEAVGSDKAWRLLEILWEAEHEHAVMLARLLGAQLAEIQALLAKLEEAKLVVEVKPRTLKAKHRRAKVKRETRCLHKYYKLTRLAEMILRLTRGG